MKKSTKSIHLMAVVWLKMNFCKCWIIDNTLWISLFFFFFFFFFNLFIFISVSPIVCAEIVGVLSHLDIFISRCFNFSNMHISSLCICLFLSFIVSSIKYVLINQPFHFLGIAFRYLHTLAVYMDMPNQYFLIYIYIYICVCVCVCMIK